MAEIWTRQQQLQRSIDRFLENFKKLGRPNLTAAKIRSRISALQDLWQQFQTGNAVLLQSTPAAQQDAIDYFSGQCFDATEETYRTALDYLTEALEELEPPVSPQNDSAFNNTARINSVSLAQLPPVSLPPFDGQLDQWESFRDRFTSLIICNSELNNFARMHFLTTCVKGQARSCIQNLPVTAANFEIAWQALVSRYENKGRLLHRHLSNLLQLPAVTRESAVELQALRDQVKVTLASLIHLPRNPSDLWSDMLIHLVVQRLDASSRRAWNLRVADHDDFPSFADLNRFLASRTRAFDEISSAVPARSNTRGGQSRQISAATVSASSSQQCPTCKLRHIFSACPIFVRGTPVQRRKLVKKHGRCFNCLSRNHSVNDCSSRYSCRVCQQRHHTLLHSSSTSALTSDAAGSATPPTPIENQKGAVNSLLAARSPESAAQVLLATARVQVRGVDGRAIEVRALLDQGSEMTFISEHLAQTLRLKRKRMPTTVSAVGCVDAGTFRHAALIIVSSRCAPSPTVSTTALILRSLTSYAPRRAIGLASLSHIASLALADPDPTGKDPIHLILGADVYGAIILDGVIKNGVDRPIAQNSIFGWVISGPIRTSSFSDSGRPSRVSSQNAKRITALHCFHASTLEANLQRFWEVEEVSTKIFVSPEDQRCESHFLATHSRDATGRYVVRLPFRTDRPLSLGNSRLRAEQQLNSIFRRFESQPKLLTDYRSFLDEYARLRHMQPASLQVGSEPVVYLPHHPVFRDSSLTTRVRIVFNASSLTSTGLSLNDHLMIGPKLQTELPAILLRWRQFRFVLSADIEKMYRQILLDPRDIDFQRILWKHSSDSQAVDYQLLTVTYGMACAPFLALRVLQQLANDESASFPLASPILRKNTYVDDVLFGDEDESALRETRDQLIRLLGRGGFALRKWASNSNSLLKDLDAADHGITGDRSLSESDVVHILGIEWSPPTDSLKIRVFSHAEAPETKRGILSAIARLYDPLGLVTPVTLAAKITMQQLWKVGVSWDDRAPKFVLDRWLLIYNDLSHLRTIQLPRWTGHFSDCTAELHGFADASNVAYAAVVYLRVINASRAATVTLLQAKSRVAPLKPVSVPRLELMAAALLSRLLSLVRSEIEIEVRESMCWSDSTVVLSWLRHHPSRWNPFVANRVAEIQSRLPDVSWSHVPTDENPADCASRGLLGRELTSHPLWWHGPDWLCLPREQWPSQVVAPPPEFELESRSVSHSAAAPPVRWNLATRFSSWPRLLRVTALVFRFVARCRRNPPEPNSGLTEGPSLSAGEVAAARIFWLKSIQSELFSDELRALRNALVG